MITIEIYVRLMKIYEAQIKGIYIRENYTHMCIRWVPREPHITFSGDKGNQKISCKIHLQCIHAI